MSAAAVKDPEYAPPAFKPSGIDLAAILTDGFAAVLRAALAANLEYVGRDRVLQMIGSGTEAPKLAWDHFKALTNDAVRVDQGANRIFDEQLRADCLANLHDIAGAFRGFTAMVDDVGAALAAEPSIGDCRRAEAARVAAEAAAARAESMARHAAEQAAEQERAEHERFTAKHADELAYQEWKAKQG